MLEIDADGGGFVALFADEPLEQNVDPSGIDGRDAQAEAARRVRRRAAPLAQDSPAAGKLYEVADGEKIGFVMQLGDKRQLVLDERADVFGNSLRIPVARSLPGQV